MTDPAPRQDSTYAIPGEDLAYLLRSVMPILPAAEWPRLARAVASARSAIDGALTRHRANRGVGADAAEAVLDTTRSDVARVHDELIAIPPIWPDNPFPWPYPLPFPWPWPWPWRPDGEPDPIVEGKELPAIALLAAGAEFSTAATMFAKHEVGAGGLASVFAATAHSLFSHGIARLGKHEP